MSTTICPECWNAGGPSKRVEMTPHNLPQPQDEPKDRFPGQLDVIPAVYYHRVEWVCPECGFRKSE
jgi:rubredoxin